MIKPVDKWYNDQTTRDNHYRDAVRGFVPERDNRGFWEVLCIIGVISLMVSLAAIYIIFN